MKTGTRLIELIVSVIFFLLKCFSFSDYFLLRQSSFAIKFAKILFCVNSVLADYILFRLEAFYC